MQELGVASADDAAVTLAAIPDRRLEVQYAVSVESNEDAASLLALL